MTTTAAGWRVSGQKVWTSIAHAARWGLLLARTDPDVPKHAGLTYFGLDMKQPGVEVRPLRQLTGEAEFNEVFLTDATVPDSDRIGGIGEGWRVAQATLMNERVAIGGGALPREGGMVGLAAAAWREHPEARTPGLHDRLIRLWADAEVARLAGARLRQQLAAGTPGPEGSAAKIVFARLNQELSAFELELAGAEGLSYDDWTLRRPESRQLLRPRARLPLPALPRELHRGRHLGDPPQHHRRAGARAARRAAHGHPCPLEGPAAMTASDQPTSSAGPPGPRGRHA